MKKQTAVEFLVEEFSSILEKLNFTSVQGLLLKDAIEKSKEMEKQQIIDAHGDEQSYLQDDGSWKTVYVEQYYNEIYKKETK
tara:strand:+ start:118 stop:363 length:246 start_codon:yes stop_codon:yes gene_type:complete